MASLNLALRFILELCGIAALATWGWSAADSLPARLLLAAGTPALLITAWALVIAPGATNPIPQVPRMLLGSGLLLLAAGALALAGHPGIAAVFAALVVANTALLLVLGG
jgi:Protein of unknown function (DUF2568)